MIGQTISHYEILEKLGEGGMGVVYKARDFELDRLVAIKVLPERLVGHEADQQRFMQEARAASALNHPHVCTIHDFLKVDDRQYIVMEYVEGRTLRDIAGSGPPAIEAAVDYAVQIAEALEEAHNHGVIHRDVKPENIMISPKNRVKVMDFGLAKLKGSLHLTKSSGVMGTLAYMSPEQARGEQPDERTDIWSLGVVLYEMLTGHLPFAGHYAAAILYLILHEDPPPMGSLRGDIPAQLEETVRRCLKKDREQRYRNIPELLDQLRAFQRATTPDRSDPRASESGAAQSAQRKYDIERRQVTVLFASLSSPEPQGRGLDPDRMLLAINECLNGLVSIIRKYEGITDRIVGEQLMVVFGAPIAREDDPMRAVRSSFDMMSFVGRYNALGTDGARPPLRLQVGIHTGIVVAGSRGAEADDRYRVIGDTVNLAAGIAEMTPPGHINVSDDTYRLVSKFVEADPPRSLGIRGRAQQAQSFRLRLLKSSVEPISADSRRKTFIGRDKEKILFAEAVKRVREREGLRISIRGEAGVGKTRLMLELNARAQEEGISVTEGRCSSFEMSTPYYLWNTFLKSLLHLGLDTPEPEIRSRLRETLQVLSLEEDEPYLAALLSLRYQEILLEVDRERKGRIYEAMKNLLIAYSGRRVNIFVLEDLHWIDRFSQELLEFVLSGNGLGPSMVVLIFRPDYAGAGIVSRGTMLMDLDRLSPGEARALALSRLGVDAIPEELDRLIHRRAEGNPFFIEEIIKTLLDKRIIQVKKGKIEILSPDLDGGVPETLQGILLARIDRLEERIREVLLDASVIGRDFSRRVLEQVVQQKDDVLFRLEKLKAFEFILENDEAREFEYLFKHYLIQEVAYNTLLVDKRRKLHGLVAEVIEKLYADRLKEFYELLAFHYERAENWSKAAEYLSRSGQKANEIFTVEESRDFLLRKEDAIAKLFESPGEKRIGWIIAATLTALIAIPLVMLMFMVPYWIGYMYWHLPPDLEFNLWGSVLLGNSAFLVYLALFVFGYPWAGALFTFLGIIPAFRERPRLFDILHDRIRIVFRSGRKLSIHFSEIDRFRFIDPKVRRPLLRRLLDPLNRVDADARVGFGEWCGEVAGNLLPPYSFGFSARSGVVCISRRRGRRQLRLLLPWLYSFAKSRDVNLTPSDPRGFHEQLQTAFTKWKRQG